MTAFSEWVGSGRTRAAEIAESRLIERGFVRREDGWLGSVVVEDGSVPVRLVLPTRFPDSLPEIYLASQSEKRCRAHVERNGKICLAPESGTLIDVDRPADVVDAALSLAASVFDMPPDEAAREIAAEFGSYWGFDRIAYSGLSETRQTGPFVVLQEKKSGQAIFAESTKSGTTWARTLKFSKCTERSGFLVAAQSLPTPPGFDVQLTFSEFVSELGDRTACEDMEALHSWLRAQGLPAWIAVSAPLGEDGNTLFAVRIPWSEIKRHARRRHRPYAKIPRELAQRGFRPNRVPKERELSFAMEAPVERFRVKRVDKNHLLRRGGGVPTPEGTTVALIGCGAVGGFVALLLACSGVQRLVLVDPDDLNPENAFRHVLGLKGIGRRKVTGLRDHLRARFPDLCVMAITHRIDEALDNDDQLLAGSEVVVLATGSETEERRLNRYFRAGSIQTIHVWVEAYGIGGHVLRTASSDSDRRGCYECLYRTAPEEVLHNGACLLAPNQKVQVTTGGCGGVHTPFAVVDAVRAAEECVRVVSETLHGSSAPHPLLVSWCISHEAALAASLHLSRRASVVQPGTTVREANFMADACEVCSS